MKQGRNLFVAATAAEAKAATAFEARLDAVLAEIRAEVLRATRKHGSMSSPHEAYAVILEEVDELWDEVKADRGREQSGLEEAVQIAAMGVRYVLDLSDGAET